VTFLFDASSEGVWLPDLWNYIPLAFGVWVELWHLQAKQRNIRELKYGHASSPGVGLVSFWLPVDHRSSDIEELMLSSIQGDGASREAALMSVTKVCSNQSHLVRGLDRRLKYNEDKNK
jgi:hypothetical protein